MSHHVTNPTNGTNGAERFAGALREHCSAIADLLVAAPEVERLQLMAEIIASIAAKCREAQAGAQPKAVAGTTPESVKPTPELLEWARQQFSEDEILAGLEEIRDTGGKEFREFVADLEEVTRLDERAK